MPKKQSYAKSEDCIKCETLSNITCSVIKLYINYMIIDVDFFTLPFQDLPMLAMVILM